MTKYHLSFTLLILFLVLGCSPSTLNSSESRKTNDSGIQRVLYNHPGLTADLGVGLWAWPMPMDYDGDGDLDLVVSCPDKPYNGTYLFENPDGKVAMPVFKPAVKIGEGKKDILVSHVAGEPRLLVSNVEYRRFREKAFAAPKKIFPDTQMPEGDGRQRFKTFRYKDFNGDGVMDLIAGIDDWGDYGWDNAFNEKGEWTRGPLHGYAYIMINRGTNDEPRYEDPFRLKAGGQEVDVYGAPFADLGDYDGDGDLDLLCGEFLDGFSYFENTGTRSVPDYAGARRLIHRGAPLRMDLQMITPTSIDWDDDGDTDIICGDEDGRVAFIENTGRVADGMPQFLPPKYFRQEAHFLKFGALVTPVSVDWDNDGDEDLVCGNTAGNVGFIENLDGGNPPRWAEPRLLIAGGEILRIQAGYNGSIQGPAEAKWGYTTLSVADWDHDGLKDIVLNSIWGKVVWYKNLGAGSKPGVSLEPAESSKHGGSLEPAESSKPDESSKHEESLEPSVSSKLAAAKPIEVEWEGKPPKPAWNWWDPEGKELATQWRTTPCVVDWNEDGLNDLVMLDHDGYLAFFERVKRGGELKLLPGERIFTGNDTDRRGNIISDSTGLLRLNPGIAGSSGRRKICIVDWDGDGLKDLLVNSINVNFLKNLGDSAGYTRIKHMGPVDPLALAGHTTSPTTVDWNRDGIPDLLIGAEDGFFYYLENPRSNDSKGNMSSHSGQLSAADGAAIQPNIIFIMIDDLGYGDLGCYGSEKNKTPNIDRMAAGGLKFTDFHSNGPMCSPTRAALMSGMYQNRLGPMFEGALSGKAEHDKGMPLKVLTIAELLKQAGYATGMYGKWHLGFRPPYLPASQGFDDFVGLGAGDGDHHTHVDRWGREDWWHNDSLDMEKGYSVDLITGHSIQFIRDHRNEPFFLYVSHLAIHFPWQGPDDPPHRQAGNVYPDDKWGIIPDRSNVQPHVRAMIEAVDQGTGEILQTLTQLSLENNTLVIFTSDNGGYIHYANIFHRISSNGVLRGQKTEVYEGGHRVPCIFYWPGMIKPGTTDETVMTMDMYLTFAGLAGAAIPEDKILDGMDLRSLVFNGSTLLERTLFWKMDDEAAIRKGNWKLVLQGERSPELYDISRDIAEQDNLTDRYPDIVAELQTAFKDWSLEMQNQVFK